MTDHIDGQECSVEEKQRRAIKTRRQEEEKGKKEGTKTKHKEKTD